MAQKKSFARLVGEYSSLAFILPASILVGYWVAGRNLQPLGAMVRDLEAITDGRSLHRRLAVERHSWREHTRKIVDTLRARVPSA